MEARGTAGEKEVEYAQQQRAEDCSSAPVYLQLALNTSSVCTHFFFSRSAHNRLKTNFCLFVCYAFSSLSLRRESVFSHFALQHSLNIRRGKSFETSGPRAPPRQPTRQIAEIVEKTLAHISHCAAAKLFFLPFATRIVVIKL